MREPEERLSDEARIESLLRAAGARTVPPAALTQQVREVVHREWRAAVASRRRRRVRTYALAASFAALACAGIVWMTVGPAPAAEIARVAHVTGAVTHQTGRLERPRRLDPDGAVRSGERVESAPGAFAALDLDGGIRLNIDEGSRVRIARADRVVLERGAVFVATQDDVRGRPFTVATERGDVRHVGTQYEVRTVARDVHISVREGRIIVDANGALHEGTAGERLEIDASGKLARATLTAEHDPWRRWHWALPAVPEFDIEAQTLQAFLDWFAHKTGRTIEFASQSAAALARTTILHGSIAGMDPDTALATVLATTDFSRSDAGDGRILLSATSEPR